MSDNTAESFGRAVARTHFHICKHGPQFAAEPILAAAALIAAVRHPEWAMVIAREFGYSPTVSEAADMLVRECPIALQEEEK